MLKRLLLSLGASVTLIFYIGNVAQALPVNNMVESERPALRLLGDYLLFSGRTLSQHIRIINEGKQAQTVSVELRDARLLESGQYEWITKATSSEAEISAIPYLKAIPPKITIEPGETKSIRLLLRNMDKLPEYEIHSHLALVMVPKQQQRKQPDALPWAQGEFVAVRQSDVVSSVPVIVRSSPADLKAEITDVSFNKESRALQVHLRRLGSHSIFGKVRVFYRESPDVEPMLINDGVFAPVMLPSRTRSMQIICGMPDMVTFDKGKLVVEYIDIIDENQPVLDSERVPL